MTSAGIPDLADRLSAIERQVAELTQHLADIADPDADRHRHDLYFPDVEAWVHGLFLPMFSWRVDGQRWHWCPQWWRHAEAIWRLELLWRSWEVHRMQPTGMSTWSVEADRHLTELLGPEGAFRQCRGADPDRAARHTPPVAATAEFAPAGWWNAARPSEATGDGQGTVSCDA